MTSADFDDWTLSHEVLHHADGRELDLRSVGDALIRSTPVALLRLDGTDRGGQPAWFEITTDPKSAAIGAHRRFGAAVLDRLAELNPEVRVDAGAGSGANLLRFLSLLGCGGAFLAAGLGSTNVALMVVGAVLVALAVPLRPNRNRLRSPAEVAGELRAAA